MTRLLIWLAGGRAVRITPKQPRPDVRFDGLVIGGGADIDPARYKEKLIESVKKEKKRALRWGMLFLFPFLLWLARKLFSLQFTSQREDKGRDDLEFPLVKHAVAHHIPVLGICRGAQLLNVALGGTLYQDISTFYVERPQLHTVLPKVRISIDRQSQLWRIFRRRSARVNALHHQAVKDLGRGLKVTARDSNGIVEAIEKPGRAFCVGVQWHPEFLPHFHSQRLLFRNLVCAARKAAAHENASPEALTPGQP